MARRRYFHKKHRSSGGFKIPLAVVAGFAPLAYDVYNGAQSNGVNGAFENATKDLTGYDIPGKKWDFGALVKGWTPILAGFVAHKMANIFGINRALGRAKIPLLRV